ncbi:5-formyltetrahydrofolate cyclo-ligase [Hesseltinella vesiculosa]|uniref:5-formyltetrahydrofolate cyclo-ligase n=1 Tax=Hesseltinella vesiculosa TaxID=101127 RepID=A0A1X2GBP1_9FUNG|nr:5-formyltetrahydrofolate cyclo-ligase [Hesseltinella vesiculosa]
MASNIKLLKRTLRKDMANKLKAVTNIQVQSDQVFQRLVKLPEFQQCKTVSIYISMPTQEIDTRNMIQHILEQGKNCYIPRCTKDTMDMVRLTSWEDFTTLPRNAWDIPEPPLDQPRENALDGEGLELMLVPGVAFDAEKNRIGHGKGYYDRYLRKYNDWAQQHGKPKVKTVALALREQMVDIGTIPLEPTDQQLDHILTADQTY